MVVALVGLLLIYYFFEERNSWLKSQRKHALIESFARPPAVFQRRENRVKVAVFAEEGDEDESIVSLERIVNADPKLELHFVSEFDIRKGILNDFDVFVVPGGSATEKSILLGKVGRKAVIDFVRAGGGYVGICAGAFLASAGREQYLGIINAKTVIGEKLVNQVGMVSMEYYGAGPVRMGFTDAGKKILREGLGVADIMFSGGPIFISASRPDYLVLALYNTEISEYDFQRGTMIGTPAIIAGKFGKGHVIAIGPHPELMPCCELLLVSSVLAASRKE